MGLSFNLLNQEKWISTNIMQKTKILEAIVGFVIVVGAVAGWHYWGIDPLIAVIAGAGGLGMVGHAFNYQIL